MQHGESSPSSPGVSLTQFHTDELRHADLANRPDKRNGTLPNFTFSHYASPFQPDSNSVSSRSQRSSPGAMAGSSFSSSLCNWLCAGCTILLFIGLPVAQVTVGVVYMDECPAAPAIPVYMMVCGISVLLLMGLLALPRILFPVAEGHTAWTLGVLSLILFIFIWFIYGSYQIYSVYPPNYDKNITGSVSSADLIYTPTAPHSKHLPTMDNQSLPDLNQTWIIGSNQTARKLNQGSFLSSFNRKTKGEQPQAPEAHPFMAEKAYCHRNMYLFAFWTTTLAYALAANNLLIVLCILVFTKVVVMLLP